MKKNRLLFNFILLLLNFISCTDAPNNYTANTNSDDGDTTRNKNAIILPLEICISHYEKELEDERAASKFCSCFMPNAAQLFDEHKINAFFEENWIQLRDEELIELMKMSDACFDSGAVSDSTSFSGYTPDIIKKLKTMLQENLLQLGFADTYDISLLTSCLAEAIQKNFTVGELMANQIMKSDRFQPLLENCATKAKL